MFGFLRMFVEWTKPLLLLKCVVYQESDLTFRLASGLVIWQPMWEHRQPDIPAFTALIKPVRNIVTGVAGLPHSHKPALIYFCLLIIKTCNLPSACLNSQAELPGQQPVQPRRIRQPGSHGEWSCRARLRSPRCHSH